MSDPTIFGLGIGMTLLFSFGVVFFLRGHLKAILIDLCGSSERAAFWCAFSNATLVLLPLIVTLDYRPGEGEKVASLWGLVAIADRGIAGVTATVIAIGIVVGSFIARSRVVTAAASK
jgi:hypothetical protein